MLRPPSENPSCSTWLKGHGPARQEIRTLRNSLPPPASSVVPPMAAFHFPSGEHGPLRPQGTPPAFTTSNDFTALPIFTMLLVEAAHRTRTLVTLTGGPAAVSGARGLA